MGSPRRPEDDESELMGSQEDLHQRLIQCDRQLLALVQQRAELLAAGAADVSGLPERRRLLNAALTGLPAGPSAAGGVLNAETAERLLREIDLWTRRAATPVRVAYLGPEDSYSHLAAIERFGESCDLIPVASIAAVFEEVAAGHCQYGLAPLENSTDGRVVDTLDMFVRVPLQICGEVPLPIRHCLLGKGPRSQVRRVMSKPQALSQCRQWLAKHVPQATLLETSSTSEAAAAAGADPSVAAIASRHAAGRYELDVLAEGIQDSPRNVTRFAVLGDRPGPPTGQDKTAIMFQVRHEPGALVEAMLLFQQEGLNMTWIESFPCRETPYEYLFFVELQGHCEDAPMRRAVDALRERALRLDVLGSYAARRGC